MTRVFTERSAIKLHGLHREKDLCHFRARVNRFLFLASRPYFFFFDEKYMD